MNQSLVPPFTGAEIVKANFKGKAKTIIKARVAPGSCTVQYKQLDPFLSNVIALTGLGHPGCCWDPGSFRAPAHYFYPGRVEL